MSTVSECIEPQYEKKGKYVFGLLQISYKVYMFNNYLLDCAIRIKNFKKNQWVLGLVNDFTKIDSILDIDLFSEKVERIKKHNSSTMIQIKCMGKESLYYGHLNNLLEYAGGLNYTPVEMPSIEHGINFYESPISIDYINNSTEFIFQGKYKKEMIHSLQPEKNVFCIGPFIHYAKDYYTNDEFKSIKSKWGRTAVLIPFHTFEHNNSDRRLGNIIQRFYEIYHSEYDSLFVCLYWLDVERNLINEFKNYGIKVVSSGARFDPKFLSRQKAIIDLADIIVGDDIGSYIGYALCENKKVELLMDTSIIQSRKNLLQNDLTNYIENQDKFFRAFKQDDLPQIEALYNYFWGGKNCIKSPEEIRFILIYSHKVFWRSAGFETFFIGNANKLEKEESRFKYLIRDSLKK